MEGAPGPAGPLDFDLARLSPGLAGDALEIRRIHDSSRLVFVSAIRVSAPLLSGSLDQTPVEAAMAGGRLTGPIQFLLKLLEVWRLDREDAARLLGFRNTEMAHVAALLDGRQALLGRDIQDRIAHLFRIWETLRSLFRDLEVENEWLREKRASLEGKTPMSLLLGGSMEDLLWVRECVEVAGRR